MKNLDELLQHITRRVDSSLQGHNFKSGPLVRGLVPLEKFVLFSAVHGFTPQHPVYFRVSDSNLAGSYFLGKCVIDKSLVFKSDLRGDELKIKQGADSAISEDEAFLVKDSYLIKTLVHNNSHDPENPGKFLVENTVSTHYANIHGAPTSGSFLAPFSTVDLTTVRNCLIGAFAYVQTGELSDTVIEPGEILVKAGEAFEFRYRFPIETLQNYIRFEPGEQPTGILMDFMAGLETDFNRVFEGLQPKPSLPVPEGSSLSPYAVVKGGISLGENVYVAQRAYLDEAWLGNGANVQENCCIINSRLEGDNVTAHGGKIIHSQMEENIFVGFNSFLNGKPNCRIKVGAGSIIMPHTIIDPAEPLEIPKGRLVWGCVRKAEDLKEHSLALESLTKVAGEFKLGDMRFQGNGAEFVHGFQHRIEHILEENGAYFNENEKPGHAQKYEGLAFNTFRPFPQGTFAGLFPDLKISPPRPRP